MGDCWRKVKRNRSGSAVRSARGEHSGSRIRSGTLSGRCSRYRRLVKVLKYWKEAAGAQITQSDTGRVATRTH